MKWVRGACGGARLQRFGGHVAARDAAAQAAEPLGERGGAREGSGAWEVGQVRQHPGNRAQGADWLAGKPEHAAAEHLEVGGHPFAVVVVAGRVDLAALGARVQDRRQDLVARHAVHRGVVDLVEDSARARPRGPGSRRPPTGAACGPGAGRAGGRPSRTADPRCPGGGMADSRTWKSMSKSGSSTQYGWSSPKGTLTNFQRNGGSRCSRSESMRRMSSDRRSPPGAVDGS